MTAGHENCIIMLEYRASSKVSESGHWPVSFPGGLKAIIYLQMKMLKGWDEEGRMWGFQGGPEI